MTKAEELLQKEMYRDTPPSEVMAIHAKEFAEWCSGNYWSYSKDDNVWCNEGILMANWRKTTSELYDIFNNQ